jgi:LysM repeat protein
LPAVQLLTEYTNTFINEMHRLGYSRVDLYLGSYFYNHLLIPNEIVVSKPWLASYPVSKEPTANFSNGKGAWQWSANYYFPGMQSFGKFDVSEDYAGKYITRTGGSSVVALKDPSLIDYLNTKHLNSSNSNRAKLAEKYGIMDYQGTAAQNMALLAKLKSGMNPAKMNPSNSKLTTTPKSKTNPATFTVRKGDTLGTIAKTFNTTVAQLVKLNNIKNPNMI